MLFLTLRSRSEKVNSFPCFDLLDHWKSSIVNFFLRLSVFESPSCLLWRHKNRRALPCCCFVSQKFRIISFQSEVRKQDSFWLLWNLISMFISVLFCLRLLSPSFTFFVFDNWLFDGLVRIEFILYVDGGIRKKNRTCYFGVIMLERKKGGNIYQACFIKALVPAAMHIIFGILLTAFVCIPYFKVEFRCFCLYFSIPSLSSRKSVLGGCGWPELWLCRVENVKPD